MVVERMRRAAISIPVSMLKSAAAHIARSSLTVVATLNGQCGEVLIEVTGDVLRHGCESEPGWLRVLTFGADGELAPELGDRMVPRWDRAIEIQAASLPLAQ